MDEISLIRVIASFGFVLGLFGVCVWLLKRVQMKNLGAKNGKRLSLTEQLYLDPKRRVVLIRCDDTEHVILIGQQQEQLLSTHPAPATPCDDQPQQGEPHLCD